MAGAAALLMLSLASAALAACPAGTIYESSYNKCYKYSASSLNFLSAEKACQTLGGSLVAVQNAYENSYISGVASASSSAPSFWIGSNLLMNTRWTWTSGYNGTYSNFASGQPSDPSIYQCAAVRDVDNAWTKELCSTQKPYMCQIDPNASVGNGCSTPSYPLTTAYPPTTGTTADPSRCPYGSCDPGYTLNPDACKCYKLTSDVYPIRNGAFRSCQAENATLPIIRNAAENDWISSLIRNRTSGLQYPWIGLLCNSSSTDSCKWDDGSALGYSNFSPGKSVLFIEEVCLGYPKNDGADNDEDGPSVSFVYNNTWISIDDTGTTSGLLCEKRGL